MASNAITGDAHIIWLALAQTGHWFTVRTLMHHLKPQFMECDIEDALVALGTHGFVDSRSQGLVLTFAVTSSCTPLPGYDLNGDPIGVNHA